MMVVLRGLRVQQPLADDGPEHQKNQETNPDPEDKEGKWSRGLFGA